MKWMQNKRMQDKGMQIKPAWNIIITWNDDCRGQQHQKKPNFTFESTLGKRDYFCMNGLIFKIKK